MFAKSNPNSFDPGVVICELRHLAAAARTLGDLRWAQDLEEEAARMFRQYKPASVPVVALITREPICSTWRVEFPLDGRQVVSFPHASYLDCVREVELMLGTGKAVFDVRP
jgi:hypothetical protein